MSSIKRSSPKDLFESLQVSYSIASSPTIGLPFKVDGFQHVTPYTAETLETSIALEAYPSVAVAGQIYGFQSWDDGLTSLIRVGDLTVKRSYTLIYQLIPQQSQVGSEPIIGVLPYIVIVFGLVTVCFLAYLASKR